MSQEYSTSKSFIEKLQNYNNQLILMNTCFNHFAQLPIIAHQRLCLINYLNSPNQIYKLYSLLINRCFDSLPNTVLSQQSKGFIFKA